MPTLHEKIFAHFNNKSDKKINILLDKYKKQLFEELHGNVLEIGIGTASNLTYYPKNINLTAIEPNTAMYPYLKKKNIIPINNTAEKLDIKSNTMDYVITTLVLCSVKDLDKALKEIKRVLKKDGKFIFIEHVVSNGKGRLIQNIINPVWKKLGLGCNLNRETGKIIKKHFINTKYEEFNLKILPMIAGKTKKN